MLKNILQCLEQSENKYSDKILFSDVHKEDTYKEFVSKAKSIGSFIINNINIINSPIIIFTDKSVNCLESMMGVIYSGNFYTVMDIKSPDNRINTIVETLNSVVIITDKNNFEKAKKIKSFKKIYLYEEISIESIDEKKLDVVRKNAIDTDPIYVLFTSGSTGIPKGTVVSHRSVIDYTSWVQKTFSINDKTIFGNQTPFYFSMSILDIFTTIISGATFYIIPKMYFSFPIKLLEFLKEKEINTIYWVPSALGIVANFKALDEIKLPKLNKILFAGEVMPLNKLNIWIKNIPNAMYANLYGPTEITDICTYYIIDRKFEDNETLPIGIPCDNCDVLIIKEDNTRANKDEEGELCVRGSFLALGYYNNLEKSDLVFVQNPLNKHYNELIYKTGDIVKYNERGELIYITRKDFQIKHMGYRIELGEIETIINAIDDINICACIYDEKESKIILFYQSEILDEKEVIIKSKEKLLSYMVPNKVIKLNTMPYNANGKIDRVYLKNILKGEI